MIKKGLIFLHRWMGVALSALFLLWFVSGIVMMYWDFPSVRAEDRLEQEMAAWSVCQETTFHAAAGRAGG